MPHTSPPWHYCVVTASTAAQARLYAADLSRRQEAGLLPRGMVVQVVVDPPRERLGSGGSTIWALQVLAKGMHGPAGDMGDALRRLARRRVLIIHCGGESRRIPLHAATGKAFAPLPAALANGRPATVFDLLWLRLAVLGESLDAGVLVASGDVLLDFDPHSVTWPEADVTGIACWADVATGSQHGVYACDLEGCVRAYLQKATRARLRAAGAIAPDGRVPIDSGLLLFRGHGVEALCALAQDLPTPPSPPTDLYTDFMAALLQERFAGRVATPDNPSLARAFRECRFAVSVPPDSVFVHLGTTRLYRDRLTRDAQVSQAFGLRPITASHAPSASVARSARVIGSSLGGARSRLRASAMVSEVWADGEVAMEPGAIAALIRTGREALTIRRDTVVFSLPVRADVDGRNRSGTVAVVHGTNDDPRRPLRSPDCTFLGTPLSDWLRARRIPASAVWPDIPDAERTLWNARLFPVAVGRGRAEPLALALWMQEDAPLPRGRLAAWLAAPRLAFADLASVLDAPALIAHRNALAAQIACEAAVADIEATGDRHLAAEWQPLSQRSLRAASRKLTAYAGRAAEPLHRARAWKLLADVSERGSRTELTRAAFHCVAEAVGSRAPQRSKMRLAVDLDQHIVALAPVRVDLAGGWTDTPPYCLEHGGAVVNVALDLDARPPIRAIARPLRERVVRLLSEDASACLETSRLQPLLAYDRPGDPLAILKAALFCTGVLSQDAPGSLRDALGAFGSGIEIRTRCSVPQGSGLGASSILAAAVVAALSRLGGRQSGTETLVDDVLRLEQMLTAGGGWQDQVGGIVGGVKLITSQPGRPQKLQVDALNVAPEVLAEFDRRLVLVDTGKTRVAKGILQAVMGWYLSREPAVISALRELHDLAQGAAQALREGKLDVVGHLMAEQWERNKILDPNATNPDIDALFDALLPHVAGAKLAGAGGGGFMAILTRLDRPIEPLLRQLGAGRPHKSSINHQGLSVHVRNR